MPCYRPLKGYRSKTVNASGKRSIVFSAKEGYYDKPIDLPCGQCVGCRLERSRQWAIRCVHEAQLYEQNCFITLTYNDENLPPDGSLNVEHFQKFMKRLRFENSDRTIRFFHCGEYGENLGRPHYHACLFNFDFDDKKYWKTENNNKYYTSEKLQRLWPLGHSMVGAVTFESAAYVARYITKKVTGAGASEHYSKIDYATGEVLSEKKPEYVTMSRRPGIGKRWFQKYKGDVFPDDSVIIRGRELKPPKFYLSQLEINFPDEYAKVKANRQNEGVSNAHDNTVARLRVKEESKLIKMKLLKRKLENES